MNIRPLICIPCFNNPETIISVVQDCLKESSLPLMVIDDGSAIFVSTLLWPSLSEEEKKRVTLYRFDENRGKGAALQFVLTKAISMGFTHVITLDADGQHLAKDIALLQAKASLHPWALIIGRRHFQGDHIPESSRFGRKFSNFWVYYQTNFPISDSQSGFRVYPLFHLQKMTFFTKRYDFEIEVLIRLLWKKVDVYEEDIDVVYLPKEKRISHFHKFKDNVRISLLNTLFVMIVLLRSHLTKRELSLGVALGLFVGSTPLIGFHTAIISLLAVIFRLNWVVLWLGTQISLPPLMPFLFYGAGTLGCALFQECSWSSFFIGSLVQGAILALIGGFLTFAFTSFVSHPKKRNWTGGTRGGKFGNWFLGKMISWKGPKLGRFFLAFIVPYFMLFAPKGVAALREYGKHRWPSRGFFGRLKDIYCHFFSFGSLLIDRIYQGVHGEKIQFEVLSQGQEQLASHQGPLIMILAHVGAFDMSVSYLKKFHLFDKIHIVKNDPNEFAFENIKKEYLLEKEKALEILPNRVGQSILEVKMALEESKWVAFMADRPSYEHCELIPFFDGLIPLDTTPFKIAALLKVPLCYCFSFRKNSYQYQFYGEDFRYLSYDPSLSKEESLYHFMSHFAKTLEERLRDYPYQWLNFYPVWSSVPDRAIKE